jgi:hypothetical protein
MARGDALASPPAAGPYQLEQQGDQELQDDVHGYLL